MGDAAGEPVATIHWLVGVHNAKGLLRGEVTYFFGARLGRVRCALCVITHGLARERAEWKACRETLAVPFATYHLNDEPREVSAAYDGVAPVVLAETNVGVVKLLGPDDLAKCDGSVDRFAAELAEAATRLGLAWPT